MRISDLSSDVCSSDLDERQEHVPLGVPDVPLGGEEGVALGAGGQRHPPFEHLEQRAEGEADRGDEERQPARAAEPIDAERRATDQDLARSEEHTSELQSLMRISYAVFCLTNKK